jgi:hypothetical protein
VTGVFEPNLELNARFYSEVVAPILEPWPHSAARIGQGSEILGFDTERSTDHGWGLRLSIFVAAEDAAPVRAAVKDQLPESFAGWPVRYGWDDYPVTDHVEVAPLAMWSTYFLGCDATQPLSTIDWLLIPQQHLLGATRGAVYHDGLGTMGPMREQLAWYPDDIAQWMLACQWQRVAQEEAFTGRTAEVGDELGSQILAARLVRELMCVHFLLARQYWPYMKWFGSAYRALPDADELIPHFEAAIAATKYADREAALVECFEGIARLHDDLNVEPTVRNFYNRPFRVLDAGRFATACREQINDPWLRHLPLVGSIDQFADSTDVLSNPEYARRLRELYDAS